MANEIIDTTTGEVQVIEAGPVAVMEAAREMARVLMDIVESQKLYSDIQGKKYLRLEAWQTLAGLAHMTPRTRELVVIEEDGKAVGVRVYVELIRDSDMAVIGGAYGRCDFSERIARSGRFAAESMAQTRATSKAISQKLRYVPILAGYAGTPAEEMTGVDPKPRQPRGEKWTPNPEAEMASDAEEWGKPAAGEPEGPARENAPMALKSTPQGPLADSRGGKASPASAAGSAAGEPAWLDEPLPKIQSRPNWQGNTWRWLASAKPGSNRHSWVNGVLDNPQAPKPLRLRCEYVMLRIEGKA